MCAGSQGSAVGSIKIQNARTRVTEWRFAKKGDNTGWHRHEYDYVVVPLFNGCLRIQLIDGEEIVAELRHGEPYFRELGVAHDVVSDNDFECAFIEIEFLDRPRV